MGRSMHDMSRCAAVWLVVILYRLVIYRYDVLCMHVDHPLLHVARDASSFLGEHIRFSTPLPV